MASTGTKPLLQSVMIQFNGVYVTFNLLLHHIEKTDPYNVEINGTGTASGILSPPLQKVGNSNP